jgi:hypothetical protein
MDLCSVNPAVLSAFSLFSCCPSQSWSSQFRFRVSLHVYVGDLCLSSPPSSCLSASVLSLQPCQWSVERHFRSSQSPFDSSRGSGFAVTFKCITAAVSSSTRSASSFLPIEPPTFVQWDRDSDRFVVPSFFTERMGGKHMFGLWIQTHRTVCFICLLPSALSAHSKISTAIRPF